MAVRSTNQNGQGAGRTWVVALTLLVLFVAALFLRAYWNLDAAHDGNGNFVLSGGSDPYYHKRAIDAIQENGFKTLVDDPLLNYPYGSINPNPPLYEWSVAVAGQFMAPMFGGDVALATWWATVWSPAILGALTLIPVYFIGKTLFDRRVGVVAALFWTISTSAIDATGLGAADHDAMIMFFATLSFLFYIKALAHFRGDGNWVARWKDGGAVASGLGRFFRERRTGLGYAVLAGIALGAVALTWKGFAYVVGIMFLYACLQMVFDHWRNRDSTGLFVGTLLTMVVGLAMALPFYFGTGVESFLQPIYFIVGGFFIAGLVLVPTRDLPTILVFPAALILALVGIVVAFFVVPEVAQGLLYATVYFKRTALYETIAEAHPADFSTIVFGIGPLPFFLALAGWGMLLFTVKRHPTRPIAFALLWGAVALYMANSAVRFLFNAIPVFAIFGAFMTVWLWDWFDFAAIRKSLAANRGNSWQGLRKGVRPSHVVTTILVVLLFVLPNGLLAADAALPPTVEDQLSQSDSQFIQDFANKRLRAYGQGFISPEWVEALQWLDQHDAGIQDPAARPAFLSWWDYGHWAIALGHHPAVADNFQNGYEFAANFLLAQNETHAIQLMGARIMPLVVEKQGNAAAESILQQAGSTNPSEDLKALLAWQYLPSLTKEQSVELLSKLEDATGKKIRYFTVDARMLPLDDPRTTSIEQSSIYYAPIKLAEREPDDYVATMINMGTTAGARRDGWVNVTEYENLARDPIRQHSPIGERLEYQPAFFNSMYYRAYVGGDTPQAQPGQPILGDALLQAVPRPGQGLEHFRLVFANREVKILEYTPGAWLEGKVTEEGTPISGATVTVYDDAGAILSPDAATAAALNVPHASAVTDLDGNYRVPAVFGNLTVVASRGGVELSSTMVNISREQAEARETLKADLNVQRGNVAGVAFEDLDGDGQKGANESAIQSVTVQVADKTAVTDAEGAFTVTGISAGRQNVTVESDTYEVAATSSTLSVRPGETTNATVALVAKSGSLAGKVSIPGGENGTAPVEFAQVFFRPDTSVEGNTAEVATTVTATDGNYAVQKIRPGTYLVTSSYTDRETNTEYELNETLVIGIGESKTQDYTMTAATDSSA